ncbi:thioredoxin family protein [Limnobacter alexandrii]|uniref:thioredoxin family protein n=1 Tax=Limnobacter alexandrii TaxID=2570352 RepID=UPI001109B471|nr:thioredoxin fold domain-containing protein [Limnobacter alexandrii]
MKRSTHLIAYRLWLLALFFLFSSQGFARDIEPKPMHYELPSWFKQTFLEIPVDVQDAQTRGKKLLIFFHLDDCPYCAHLLQENFTEGTNREKIEGKFDVIAINVRGDLPVNWIDGTVYTEKQLARKLGVFATPAVLTMGPKPEVTKKIMGYKKPGEFMSLLGFNAH